MEARLLHLFRLIICGHHTNIVRRNRMGSVSKTDGKRSLCLDILGGLMTSAQTQYYLVCIVQAAPCGIHGIRIAVFIIGADHKHRQRIKPGFCSKILTHCESLLISARLQAEPFPHTSSAFPVYWCNIASACPKQ